MEEDDWKKLSIKDKICHKVWKARLEGYEELNKQLPLLEVHEVEVYCDVVRKAPLEANAATLDKALECTLSFFQNAPSLSDREFGGKVIDVKSVVKVVPKYLAHNDKNVRSNAKAIAIECYYYLGEAIRAILVDIQPVQLKELEEEFGKLKGQPPPAPPRKIRSQQHQTSSGCPLNETPPVDDQNTADEALDVIDPYDLLDPVDIIPMIPAEFYSKISEAKWQSRKEALESVAKLSQSPKIAAGNFSNLIASLKKVVASDVNVNVCLLAVNTTGSLAKGLRCEFSPYCSTIVPALLDRFKEKKSNVVAALRDAVDACSVHWTLDNVTAVVTPYYDHKVPAIREESIKYLGRFLAHLQPSTTIDKTALKNITTDLVKRMDDSVAPVREATAEVFAVLMQMAGEKVMNALLDGQLDDIKKNKIKSIYQKMTGASESVSSVGKQQPVVSKSTTSNLQMPAKPTKVSTPITKPNSSNNKPTTTTPKPSTNPYENDADEPVEPDLEEDLAIEKAMGSFLTEQLETSLTSSVWKERLESVETIKSTISADPQLHDPCVVFKVLSKKPGWRDGNIQVFKLKLNVMSHLTAVKPFSRRAAHNLIPILADKFGDIKLKDMVRVMLIELAEAVSLNFVTVRLANILQATKSVKVQSEILGWINDMLTEFGFKIDIKPHITMLKFALEQINPDVKKCAVNLAGRMYVCMGAAFKALLADIKPAQLQQIEAEYSRIKSHPTPKPFRGVEKAAGHSDPTSNAAVDNDSTSSSNNMQQPTTSVDLQDIIERVDISSLITDEIIASLEDKNWKIRTETLEKINNIFKSRKPVKITGLYPLITAVVARLQDNNKNIIVLTLNICGALIESIGPHIYEHKNTLLRAVLNCLMDSKPNVQNAAMTTLEVWNATIPIRMTLNSDCLVVSELLSVENPNLRVGIVTYLSRSFESVPASQVPPQCVESLVHPVFKCLVDRKNEVRKVAQELIPTVIKFVGANSAKKMANELDNATKNVVIPIVEQSAHSLQSSAVAAPQYEVNMHAINTVEREQHTEKVHLEEVEMEEDNAVLPTSPPKVKFVVDSKKAREHDDSTHKIIQWSFGSLRPHYITHLNELMTPFFSGELLDLLFHADFKNHIAAAQLLAEICTNGSEEEKHAYFECFDLVLKWCVIKFFETSPVIHVRALELLETSLQEFQKCDRLLCDYEVNSFINYLCIKFGDPKENVRKLAHQVFNSLIPLYDSAKLFSCLTFGLRHKLARVKADSLFEMTSMLENDNIEKFVEVLGVVVPEVAKFVVDRDVNIKRNAIQFFSQIYLSMGPIAVDYVDRCDKSVRDVIVDKFDKLHPQYLALKQSQLFLLQEHHDANDAIVTDEYVLALDQHSHHHGNVDEPSNIICDSLLNLSIEEQASSTTAIPPQKYTFDKEPYLQTVNEIKSLSPPKLIPIDETLLISQPIRDELAANLNSNVPLHYCLESDYIENFLKVESIIEMLIRDNTMSSSLEEQLLSHFNCMNNDVLFVNMENQIVTHIEHYYARNMLMWIDALALFDHILRNIDKENYTETQHHMDHNYIETCLYQINIFVYNSKFVPTFTAQLQFKLFSLLMHLNANETFIEVFKLDKVTEIMSSVVAQLITCTPVIQSLSVILDLIQCHMADASKVEFLLRLFWKCSQALSADYVVCREDGVDAFVSAYSFIYSTLLSVSNHNSDYFVLLDYCLMNVVKKVSKHALFSLPTIINDNQLKSHVENNIAKMNIQLADSHPPLSNADAKSLLSTLENNVANFVDYKNSLEKLVRYRTHGVESSNDYSHDKLDNLTFGHIENLIKWRASLDNITKCQPAQHIINGKLLQEKYGVDYDSSNSHSTLVGTPTQPVRKYISQLLDTTNNSGLNLSNMNFASPKVSSAASPNVASSNKVSGSNLASLKARLDKIKAKNT